MAGDFNGSVGTGKEGNSNVDYYMINNLIITNAFYAHKEIHNFTKQESSRAMERNNRNQIKNVRIEEETRYLSTTTY